jgi:hypothetical protein
MNQLTNDVCFVVRIRERVGEGSYCRGVSQALALAANLAQQRCTWQDLCKVM